MGGRQHKEAMIVTYTNFIIFLVING